jgi:hypothetical protein
MAQNEISSPVSILDDSGWPRNFGWARHPYFFYDPGLLWAPRRRLSEADRYIVFSPTHLLIMEIRDDGVLGSLGITAISLKDKKRSTHIHFAPFSLGSFDLPPGSESGSIRIERKKSMLNFVTMEGGVRIIKADFANFGHNRSLRGELVLSGPSGAESLVTTVPWRREKNAFRYSRRSPWYIVEGVVQIGSTELVFTRGNAWGIFDWNRGVRPHADVRYWAAGCGMNHGRQLGFSVGYGSSDSSMGTDNAFFLDGKLNKLDQVTFHINPGNWLLPWRFTSNDNRLEMLFTPHQERIQRDRMFFFSQTSRQVCGFFSGKAVCDDGSVMEFRNITGFAERRRSRF